MRLSAWAFAVVWLGLTKRWSLYCGHCGTTRVPARPNAGQHWALLTNSCSEWFALATVYPRQGS